MDPDQGDAREIVVALDELVRDAGQGPRDRFGVEDCRACSGIGAYDGVRGCLTFDSFPASRDRVKGVLMGARLQARPDGNRDQPLDTVVDALRELALGALEPRLVVLVRDQVERRDVLAADAL
jgi:hypothetical protein